MDAVKRQQLKEDLEKGEATAQKNMMQSYLTYITIPPILSWVGILLIVAGSFLSWKAIVGGAVLLSWGMVAGSEVVGRLQSFGSRNDAMQKLMTALHNQKRTD